MRSPLKLEEIYDAEKVSSVTGVTGVQLHEMKPGLAFRPKRSMI
jgi:hypothetical protein